jgi:hypothetical protein
MPWPSIASTVASAAVIDMACDLAFGTGAVFFLATDAYLSGNELSTISAFSNSSSGALPKVFSKIALILPVR